MKIFITLIPGVFITEQIPIEHMQEGIDKLSYLADAIDKGSAAVVITGIDTALCIKISDFVSARLSDK